MPQLIRTNRRHQALAMLVGATALVLAGCTSSGGGIGQTRQSGYIASDIALQQVPVGSSKDQVLIALGSPSTTAQFGGEVFYYISQTRNQPVLFMQSRVVDQRVLAIYFNGSDRVERIADYGLQDGQVFDFVTRTTPTGGEDLTFVQQILRGVLDR